MKCLVSICNKQKPVGLQHPDCFLYEITVVEGCDPRPVRLEHPKLRPAGGMTGLARYRDGILAVTQAETPQMVFLDFDYRVRDVWDLPLSVEAHSLCLMDGKIYIAATGLDSVVEFEPSRGERLFWRDNLKNKDSKHLNSLTVRHGRLLITAFGKKVDKHWRSATQGYVVDSRTGATILSGLYHPHSLQAVDDVLYLCESYRSGVLTDQGEYLTTNQGYTRGLALTPEFLLVGGSTGRVYSRSTGEAGESACDPDLSREPCRVAVYLWNGERLETCRLAFIIGFSSLAREIYDILPLD